MANAHYGAEGAPVLAVAAIVPSQCNERVIEALKRVVNILGAASGIFA